MADQSIATPVAQTPNQIAQSQADVTGQKPIEAGGANPNYKDWSLPANGGGATPAPSPVGIVTSNQSQAYMNTAAAGTSAAKTALTNNIIASQGTKNPDGTTTLPSGQIIGADGSLIEGGNGAGTNSHAGTGSSGSGTGTNTTTTPNPTDITNADGSVTHSDGSMTFYDASGNPYNLAKGGDATIVKNQIAQADQQAQNITYYQTQYNNLLK